MIILQVWTGWPQWPRQNHPASPHRHPLPSDPSKHRRPLLRAGGGGHRRLGAGDGSDVGRQADGAAQGVQGAGKGTGEGQRCHGKTQ